jgi:hypothetical protein
MGKANRTDMGKEVSESDKFDGVVRTLLSVSHEEIQRRDEEWHRKRAKKKKLAKPSTGKQGKA